MKKRKRPEPRRLTIEEAVQTFCMACRCAADMDLVKGCRRVDCPLHPHRFGTPKEMTT